MATLLGRLRCSLCEFEGAHVKVNGNKLPYQHCPDCGAMLTTKSKHQARLLLSKMRALEPGADDVSTTPAAAEPPREAPAAPVPVPPAVARQVKSSFWSQMAGKP